MLNRERLSDANVKVFEAKTSLVVSEANVKSFFFVGKLVFVKWSESWQQCLEQSAIQRASVAVLGLVLFPFPLFRSGLHDNVQMS